MALKCRGPYFKSVCTHGCCKLITWNEPTTGYVPSPSSSGSKAGVILTDDKHRLLVVQSRNSKWGFPKGSVEPYESITQCASRELREETTLFIPVGILETKPIIQLHHLTLFVVRNYPAAKININHLRTATTCNDVSGIGWVNPTCFIRRRVAMTKALSDYITLMSTPTTK